MTYKLNPRHSLSNCILKIIVFYLSTADKGISHCHRFYISVRRDVCQNLASVQDIYQYTFEERSMEYVFNDHNSLS